MQNPPERSSPSEITTWRRKSGRRGFLFSIIMLSLCIFLYPLLLLIVPCWAIKRSKHHQLKLIRHKSLLGNPHQPSWLNTTALANYSDPLYGVLLGRLENYPIQNILHPIFKRHFLSLLTSTGITINSDSVTWWPEELGMYYLTQ